MQRGNNNINNGNGGLAVHQACASCKHQRKRCGEDCVLAPFFPAERSHEFQAVHKVFGVSNASKLMKAHDHEQDRKSSAESLIWEAICWQNDPVSGPLGQFNKLKKQFKLYEDELNLYKSKYPPLNPNQNQNQLGQQQGVVLYNKQGPAVVARNGATGNGITGGGLAKNNMVNYGQDNGNNLIVDSIAPAHNFAWHYVQSDPENLTQEIDVSPLRLPQQHQRQHHSFGGYNQQQYYLPGQFAPISAKKMDSTFYMGDDAP